MSKAWDGAKLADAIRESLPDAIVDAGGTDVWIKPDSVPDVMRLLRDDAEFRFELLSSVTAVDYISYFEVVYHLTSLTRNATAVVKSKVGFGREEACIPSVVDIWRGADLQEREVWDLMGIIFDGHPNHKRIMLWEGFPGHPLRKDFATYEQSIVPESERRVPSALAGEIGDGQG
ncbi:MAG: NADH-quinone oxidoreductase subunit C [Chloroflexi bacterium]|nr:NADH-quinone oxidoreductase subunit C [Chloroflexota bacterium]MYF78572.1 NADH-quinone oxidoreductase subunit C [Chloroflexota bacterium]MYK62223.1 NADH-quinone oxidoreductase subunit C [Chloroflexota bacterium]